MREMKRLKVILGSLVGAKARRLGLYIWPDANAPDDTDVRLYLGLTSKTGIAINVTIGTDEDGQTPCIEFAHVDGSGVLLSALETRRKVWSRDEFWQSQASFRSELFLISPDSDCFLARVCDQLVTRMFLVCFVDAPDIATGVVLELENGDRVWSVPSTYGNAVKSKVPDDWWPSPVILRDVKVDD
jgi:hypothetical protein